MSVAAPFSSATGDADSLVDLIVRIAGGDQTALESLYEITLGRVYAVAQRVLGHAADAEEAVADTYLQVWNQAGDYQRQRGEPMAWLQTLAWSRAMDISRRRRRRSLEVELHPDDDAAAYRGSEEPNAEQLAERWWAARQVRAAFAVLSEPQQCVLRLLFQEDLSQQEVADRTGWPLGTVKSHARRGLASLREAMQAGEDADD